ncbi:hypothetical protein EDEG_03345 [Edhazardia aedis USNM 41457]|uniref:Uncharacterized protein n=1 Tax=Edhazardia aedis (strain USNM 41457) TaxID=1003232 RepID=J9DLI9_EDHAE|nr:hypothetical protein EDEG_03345 [Edhazardia aedis USNM 41457]|eukprot:EJW02227.1 hypothetical protein EDEG_03345 [Edhazardia aedis USNM 41457]
MHKIVLNTLLALALLSVFYTIYTPKRFDEIQLEKNELYAQKIKLILYDYNNVAMFPVRNVIHTLNEFSQLCEFIYTRFENLNTNLAKDEYTESVENLIFLVKQLSVIITGMIDELSDLEIKDFSSSTYQLFDIIIEKIDNKKDVIVKAKSMVKECLDDIAQLKARILDIQSSGAIILYNSEEFNKAIKPLKSVLCISIDMLEKIGKSLDILCSENSFFNQRLSFMKDAVLNWKNTFVHQ